MPARPHARHNYSARRAQYYEGLVSQVFTTSMSSSDRDWLAEAGLRYRLEYHLGLA
jgi:hypothetical protein